MANSFERRRQAARAAGAVRRQILVLCVVFGALSCTSHGSSTAELIETVRAALEGGSSVPIELVPNGYYVLDAANNTESQGPCSGANGMPLIVEPIVIHGNGATIERNPASLDEFRIFSVSSTGSLILKDLTVQGGLLSAGDGAGICNQGTLTLQRSTVSHNSAAGGAGIFNSQGQLSLAETTLAWNHALFQAGALGNIGGELNVVNSTISENSAGFSTGGMWLDGSGTILHSTITKNRTDGSFGGLYLGPGSEVVTSSIVAGNIASRWPDCGGGWRDSGGHNLVGDPKCPLRGGFDDMFGLDPVMGPLADNGGSTWTHALLPSSPAIDAAGLCGMATDQIGTPRIGPCDIGSYEYPADVDGDGIIDAMDACWYSDMSFTVVVGDCDSLAPNQLLRHGPHTGCTVADLVAKALASGRDDAVETLLEHLSEQLGLLSDGQAEAIEDCTEPDGDYRIEEDWRR
ncbi:MAG: hypothetical protein MJD61_16905 [Proteobacteria bacterium]|nr:hypothetical protein [Pseudomonadota bacterium]